MPVYSALCRCCATLMVAISLPIGTLAADVAVLSAGAIEPGIKAAAAAFEKQTGHSVKITFNTAPELRKRMEANPAFDVVVAPPAVIADFAAANKLAWRTDMPYRNTRRRNLL